MKKLLALLLAGLVSSPFAFSAVTAYSPPVGGMSYSITAGSVGVPVTTAFALPLVDEPAASGATIGRISSVTATSITVTGANWTAGALATAAYPYAIRVTSGSAAGYTFSVTANTSDTLTISGGSPVSLGVLGGSSGDTFRLIPIDTLNTLFGSTTFQGGASASQADVITLSSGSQTSYYYNTTVLPNRWVRTTGPTTDRGNTIIPLGSVISVTRKSSAMTLRIVGRVPTERFNMVVSNAGSTYTHTGFPTDVTLGSLSMQTALAGWVSAPAAANADILSVVNGAGVTSYFHNGTNWQRTTGPSTNRDSISILSGTPILIFKRGIASGSSLYIRNAPYTF